MQYTMLGNTGMRVSRLGLGGAFGRTTDRAVCELVDAALDLGITFIDTAHAYVDSERRLGIALRGRRERVVLASKVGKAPAAYRYENVIGSVEESLRRLQTDWIDLIQLHSLEHCGERTALEETLPAFLKLKEQGKVRAIGVSARRADALAPYARERLVDVVQPFGTYTLIDRTAEEALFPHTRRHRIGVVMASPLWMGILADVPGDNVRKREAMLAEAERRVGQLAFLRQSDRPGTLVEPAMRFCLGCADIDVTLTGARSVAELRQNVAFCDGGGLPARDRERVAALFRGEPLQ